MNGKTLILLALLLVAVLAAACQPSKDELRAMIAAEVKAQLSPTPTFLEAALAGGLAKAILYDKLVQIVASGDSSVSYRQMANRMLIYSSRWKVTHLGGDKYYIDLERWGLGSEPGELEYRWVVYTKEKVVRPWP